MLLIIVDILTLTKRSCWHVYSSFNCGGGTTTGNRADKIRRVDRTWQRRFLNSCADPQNLPSAKEVNETAPRNSAGPKKGTLGASGCSRRLRHKRVVAFKPLWAFQPEAQGMATGIPCRELALRGDLSFPQLCGQQKILHRKFKPMFPNSGLLCPWAILCSISKGQESNFFALCLCVLI